MPRPAKGPRLYQRKDDGAWLIRDTGQPDRRTGTRLLAEAEKTLAAYINSKSIRTGSPDPNKVTVSTCLQIYCEEHAPTVSAPERIAYAAEPLIRYWAEQPVSNVRAETCRRYARQRNVSDGTVRRELTTLRAALNYCHHEGYLLSAPSVWLPDRPPSKERWLTRSEAARLLWAAYRLPRGKHLARFILVSLYTGTRKAATLSLQYRPNTHGGWIDTERGVLYRKGKGQKETKKRRPSAKIPRQLLNHARRWEREGGRYVVEWKGVAPRDIKTAWAAAVAAADLPGVTPHTLKHTAITWALQRGASIWDCAVYFGTSAATIQTTYGHEMPESNEAVVRALEG